MGWCVYRAFCLEAGGRLPQLALEEIVAAKELHGYVPIMPRDAHVAAGLAVRERPGRHGQGEVNVSGRIGARLLAPPRERTLGVNAPALLATLGDFAEHGVNLAKLESRPRRGAPFEYLFHVDLDGSVDDDEVRAAIEAARAHTSLLRVLGSYPAAT